MLYSILTNSKLKVSHIGFGCEPLGGTDWGVVDKKGVINAVQVAIEKGINFFDTADVYGLGKSEEMLANALGKQRHKVVILTKFGINWTLFPNSKRANTFYDSSPKRVREALHKSLIRLKIDSIPIYLIHWPDPKTPIEKTMAELIKAKKQGKIQNIGVSNFSASQIEEAHSMEPLTCVEIPYNLLFRQSGNDIFPTCQRLGISVLAYGPLAQGYLTCKYKVGIQFQDNDRRSRLNHFKPNNMISNEKVLRKLEVLSKKYHCSCAQIAIRWILDLNLFASVIVGAKTSDQVENNVNITNLHIKREDMASLSNIIN